MPNQIRKAIAKGDANNVEISPLLIGLQSMETFLSELLLLWDVVVALSVSDTPGTEEVMLSAFSEMETLIRSISGQLMILRPTLNALLKIGKPTEAQMYQASFGDDF